MRILIATDGSDCSKKAVKKSFDFIRPGSPVKVVSVFEDVLPLGFDQIPISSESYQMIEDALSDLATQSVNNALSMLGKKYPNKEIKLTSEVLRGHADQAIVEEAKRWKADLIIVGSHGRGFLGRLLGSVSNGVVHHAPCTVAVVR